jgi:hypothetical protein
MANYLRLGGGGELEEAPLPAGGGSAAVKEVEIDFGSTATRQKTFTITDLDVSGTSIILIGHSAKAATGRAQDENEMDTLLCRAAPGAGEFTLYITAFPNLVSGKFRVAYTLG